MATDLLSVSGNAVYGFFELSVGHFNEAIGSSRIANSAYHNWPTDPSNSLAQFTQATAQSYAFKV